MTDLESYKARVLEFKTQAEFINVQIDSHDNTMIHLCDDLLALVKALENECCCPGEKSWTTGEDILCDTCEALQNLKLGRG